MAEVKTSVLWTVILGGEIYRLIREDGHPNDGAGYTGSVRFQKIVSRPDGTTFWHDIAGEAFNPNDAATNQLGPMYGSFDELVSAYPRILMPETFQTKEDIEALIEDWRKRQVDRFLDRASETFGKYWNPARAALARERTKALRNRLADILDDLDELLGGD